MIKNVEQINTGKLKEDTAVPNPAAKSKYEAILWLSQHQSWHNGQIAIIKRCF